MPGAANSSGLDNPAAHPHLSHPPPRRMRPAAIRLVPPEPMDMQIHPRPEGLRVARTRRSLGGTLLLMMTACGGGGTAAPAPAPEPMTFAPSLSVDLSRMQRLRTGVYVRDVVPGIGPAVQRGAMVRVRYAGWLTDGTVVDAVLPPSEPRVFRLVRGQVIRGWESGLEGMRPGGQRQLVVPPDQAYGRRGRGGIPPNATLVFLVELVSVR
jgi:hypothetical protein